MSRVVKFKQLGSSDVLFIEQRPIPSPQLDEVVLEVKAIGMNRADIMLRTGNYLEKATFPSQLGFEAAGTVIQTGSSVTRYKVGDNVCVLPGFNLSQYGTYADHAVLPEHFIIPLPENASFQQGAALWMSYLTAYGGLCVATTIKEGDWVAITAASSSVGLAAIQIVKQLGGKPLALTLTSEKTDALLRAGAEAVIATLEESLVEQIMNITGSGIQVAFDAVGGPQVTSLAEVMTPHGTIIVHGALSSDVTTYPLKLALKKSLTIRGYVYTEVTRSHVKLDNAFQFISQGLMEGMIRPQIDRVFSLENVQDAHRYLESNKQFGKVIIATSTGNAQA